MAWSAVASRYQAPAIALAAALLWLIAAPPTPDLAAAVYRAGLFARDGLQLYDSAWFGGHHLPGYSVVAPALEDLFGVRPTGVVAAVTSALLFDRLATHHWGARARPAVLWFAAATVADLMIGRITFGIGVAFGLGSLLALQRGRAEIAVGMAVACSAASPVAGVFLTLASAAAIRSSAGTTAPATVAGAAGGCVVALALAFPEGGVQPFATGSLAMAIAASGLVAYVAGGSEPVVRRAALLYGLIAIVAFAVPTPLGSNLSRLGAAFAGPVLLAMLLARPQAPRALPAKLAVVAVVVLAMWQWLAPVREVARGLNDPAYGAAYYAPLIDRLSAEVGTRPVRIEIPFTRSHWEAVHVAHHFPLARGWQTQLDKKYNALFFKQELAPETYRRWLRHNAVSFVALPDAPLDPSGRAEARLIERRVPYLREIWRNENWRLFRVTAPSSLTEGPARLVELTQAGFVLDFASAAPALVRMRWTPYFVVEGGGCVQRAGEWTRVEPARAGRVRVKARFAMSRLVERERNCASGSSR